LETDRTGKGGVRLSPGCHPSVPAAVLAPLRDASDALIKGDGVLHSAYLITPDWNKGQTQFVESHEGCLNVVAVIFRYCSGVFEH